MLQVSAKTARPRKELRSEKASFFVTTPGCLSSHWSRLLHRNVPLPQLSFHSVWEQEGTMV